MNRTYAPIRAFVDELARCGMTHGVTSPGSRNAPLALTLAGEPRIEALSVLDERSAGFAAIGAAKATGRPVAVTCTSGTASANLLPAVVEASEARVPLIVLTADRPPELREVGAGQAIDQIKLYGSFVRWFVEVGNHEPSRATAVHYRSLAARAFWTAAGDRPGPVHLNFPLREPLAPRDEPDPDEVDWEGRPGGRPWIVREASSRGPADEVADQIAERVAAAPRGAIVCGPGGGDVATAVTRLAAATGWPVLADALSGVRCGPHDRSRVVAHYDALLRSKRFAEAHRADLVVRIGDAPTSKPLRAWLAGGEQVVVDPEGSWHDPTRGAGTVVAADPVVFCEAIADRLPSGTDDDWTRRWLAADAIVPEMLAACDGPLEPKAYAELAEDVADGATIWLSSSMPVRSAETFFPSCEADVRFLANRGANGIDGVASSATGAAWAGGRRLLLLTGELALLHDLGGLLAARRHGIELTVVCTNNGGGGIFDFLPVAQHAPADAYEEHVATPSDVDLADVARLTGLAHSVAESPAEVRAAATAPGLVELRDDRRASVAAHGRLFEEIRGQLDARSR